MKKTQLCELHTDYEEGIVKKLSGIEWEYHKDRLVYLQRATRYGKQFLNITAKENNIEAHHAKFIFRTAMTGTGITDLPKEFIFMDKQDYKLHEPKGYLYFALWKKMALKRSHKECNENCVHIHAFKLTGKCNHNEENQFL